MDSRLKYFLILFFPCILFAEGPLFQYKDPKTQLEFQNVYKDLRSLSVAKPNFLVTNSAGASNVTGDGTTYTVLWPTEVYDMAGSFTSNVFTAPKSGKYLLSANVSMEGILAAHNHIELRIVTSNRTYEKHNHISAAIPDYGMNVVTIADMEAGDTAYVAIFVDGSTKVVDITADATNNFFSGCLIN